MLAPGAAGYPDLNTAEAVGAAIAAFDDGAQQLARQQGDRLSVKDAVGMLTDPAQPAARQAADALLAIFDGQDTDQQPCAHGGGGRLTGRGDVRLDLGQDLPGAGPVGCRSSPRTPGSAPGRERAAGAVLRAPS